MASYNGVWPPSFVPSSTILRPLLVLKRKALYFPKLSNFIIQGTTSSSSYTDKIRLRMSQITTSLKHASEMNCYIPSVLLLLQAASYSKSYELGDRTIYIRERYYVVLRYVMMLMNEGMLVTGRC